MSLIWLLLMASTDICIAGEYQVSRIIDGDIHAQAVAGDGEAPAT
jgi:hypothetical protein